MEFDELLGWHAEAVRVTEETNPWRQVGKQP